MTSIELKQQRAEIHASLKDLRGKIGKDGLFTDTVHETAWHKAEEDYRKISERIEQVERAEAIDREMLAAQLMDAEQRAGAPKREVATDTHESAFNRYLLRGFNGLNDTEKRLLESRGTSTQITTTDSLGGYLVPRSFSNQLELVMKYYGGILTACDIFDDPIGGTLEWPTGDDTATTGSIQTTQGASVAVSDMTFGQVLFGHYTFTSGVVKVSKQLMQDERVGLLTNVLTEALGSRMGRNINAKLTTGTGTNEPFGIITSTTVGKTATSSTAFTQGEIIDLMYSVDRAYRESPSAGFMMHDTIMAAARKLDVANTNTVQFFTPSLIAGEPDRVLGKPIYINNDMASALTTGQKVILFGDFSKYKIRRILAPTVERNDNIYWDSLNVGFMGYQRLDAKYIASGSIKFLALA
jgi:HK97 family phage major capsid protein